MPKVSIIMSVYNSEKYLKDAIDSILRQTFPDFEFIVINDGSTDASKDIIAGYSDSRIRLVEQSNTGLTKALIAGVKKAEGEYIARMDSDDISMPARLKRQIEFMELNPLYGAVGTSAEIIDDGGIVIKKAIVPHSWFFIKKLLKYGNCFLHGSMMIRRDDYMRVGGYREGFIISQDYDLWLRLSRVKKMKNLNETLYCWRHTHSNISFNRLDEQFKIAALALYDYKFNKSLKFEKSINVNGFIESMSQGDRIKYNSCLINFCLRHGRVDMAEKYSVNRGLMNAVLLGVAKGIMALVRYRRPLDI